MALNDKEIRAMLESGEFKLDPFEPSLVQPSSIDLRINGFARALKAGLEEIDLACSKEDLARHYSDVILTSDGYVIPPRGVLIVQTKEHMTIPDTCQGMIAQRSSWMRVGLHVSSSLINPGYHGNLPVLISNLTDRPVRIYPNMPFCQLVLLRMTERPIQTYAELQDAKYQGETQFFISRISEDASRWAIVGHKINEATDRAMKKLEDEGLL